MMDLLRADLRRPCHVHRRELDLCPGCAAPPEETGEVPCLQVFTARISSRDPDRFDITRQSGGPEGAALVTSANLQRHGLDSGFELGVVLQDARAAALREILRGWAATAPRELRVNATLGDVTGEAQVWFRTEAHAVRDHPEPVRRWRGVIAASADHLESEPPAPRRKVDLPRPAHTLDLRWTVEAPRLAPSAKEIKGALDKSATPGIRGSSARAMVASSSPSAPLMICRAPRSSRSRSRPPRSSCARAGNKRAGAIACLLALRARGARGRDQHDHGAPG